MTAYKILIERRSTFNLILLMVLTASFIAYALLLTNTATSLTAKNSSWANLTIWDTTDSAERYTYPSCYETYGSFRCTLKDLSEYNIFFYANFTNKSDGESIVSVRGGNCSIRFNENLTGVFTAWVNMTYSSSTKQYQYNRSFRYKDGIPFEINCTNETYGKVNASENTSISNTAPSIFAKDSGGKLPLQSVTEDTLFYYNFSENCSDDDLDDIPRLSFGYVASNTTLPDGTFSLNTVTGNFTLNISTNTQVGDGVDKIVFSCSDGVALQQYAEMNFTITAVNDAPRFINLNSTLNATESNLFNFTIQATDEEESYPLSFNATFINCTTANWSARNSTLCSLFNLTYYNSTAVIINFTPTNDDVGNYTIQFNVSDAAAPNASRVQTIIFNVANLNNAPNITYSCNNERSTAEDAVFSCIINATDTDETSNLTFISNTTWFTFNNSARRFTANISGAFGEANISFTANDSAVGVWYINISVNDSADGVASKVINFNVSSVNDTVALTPLNNAYESYLSAEFYLEINASDDDLRVPIQGKSCSAGCYNESLTFTKNITNLSGGSGGINTTLFVLVKNATKGVIGNTSFAYIKFTPVASDTGNYTINITVRDANNYSIASKVFNLTVYQNIVPYWINLATTSFTFNEGAFALNLYTNATDDDGDAITFTDNIDLFDINSSGYISVSSETGNDSNVGSHSGAIILTDARGAINSSKSFTFTVKNVNETPKLYLISNVSTAEDTLNTISFSANDEDLDMASSYGASDYYPENIVWSVNSTTSWFTAAKLNFTRTDNRTASISFTPNKTDVGVHVINVTINDSTGRMDSQEFTLTIASINHMPYFTYIGSPMNVTLNASNNFTCNECININATDIEDGDDEPNNTNLSFASNETWFKISNTTGKVNFTLNLSYAKINWINISVTDAGIGGTGNLTNSTLFKLVVFEYNAPPVIEEILPLTGLQINLAENSTKLFQIRVTDVNAHSPNSDTLNITWKIDGVINSTSTIANASTPSLTYASNFTDETTNTTAHNLSAWVYDSQNNLTMISWNITVNHTNAPPQFTGAISNVTMSGTSYVNVTCDFSSSSGMCEYGGTSISSGGYFYDADHSDARYNQSVNLSLGIMNDDCTATKNISTISVHLNRDTLIATFYTEATVAECFNITATDAENATYNATSNKFKVNLTVNQPAQVPIPGPSGGGGGATRRTPVALKIIVPEPMTIFTKDRIVVPISIINNGSVELYDITLSVSELPPGISVEISNNHFDKLVVNEKQSIEMTIITNTNATGTYEIILTATSKSPYYTDSASFFVNLVELGWKEKIKAQEKIVFLQELLLGNPECLELQEILNQAKKEFENKNYAASLNLAENAIQACKYAVVSKGKTLEIGKKGGLQSLILPSLWGLFIFLVLYVIYHYIQRRVIKKMR